MKHNKIKTLFFSNDVDSTNLAVTMLIGLTNEKEAESIIKDWIIEDLLRMRGGEIDIHNLKSSTVIYCTIRRNYCFYMVTLIINGDDINVNYDCRIDKLSIKDFTSQVSIIGLEIKLKEFAHQIYDFIKHLIKTNKS
jgi:hypothetical protein